MSRFIEIVEVGPRDGLQNEKTSLDIPQKDQPRQSAPVPKPTGNMPRSVPKSSKTKPKIVPKGNGTPPKGLR